MSKIFTKHRMHYPNSTIESLLLPRTEGGRGLSHLQSANKKGLNKLMSLFRTKYLSWHKTVISVSKEYSALNLAGTKPEENHLIELMTKLRKTATHGRFYNNSGRSWY